MHEGAQGTTKDPQNKGSYQFKGKGKGQGQGGRGFFGNLWRSSPQQTGPDLQEAVAIIKEVRDEREGRSGREEARTKCH